MGLRDWKIEGLRDESVLHTIYYTSIKGNQEKEWRKTAISHQFEFRREGTVKKNYYWKKSIYDYIEKEL